MSADVMTALESAAVAAAHAEVTICDTAIALAGQLEAADDRETVDRLKAAAEALDYLALSIGRRLGPQGGHVQNRTDYAYRGGALDERSPAGFANGRAS